MKNNSNQLITDNPYIHNDALPIWIVPISGWGSEKLENAHKRMQIYKRVAENMKINLEFSSRLGTFQSYKNAPSVAKQIREQNDITFDLYDKLIGKDWRDTFNEEVQKQLDNL